MNVGIILAAGESKRMGTPKQLLPWGETIVLQRVIDCVAASCLERAILVLGARAEEIAGRITLPHKVQAVVNGDYRSGMDSSVRCGIRHAPPEAEALMLILGDQPFLEPDLIDRLLEEHRAHGQGITIPTYRGRRGHPVLFGARFRRELLLIGDQGAREVVQRHREAVREVAVSLPRILEDLDTPEDYRRTRPGERNV
jgi:molybdenum cofactor cytidylyltransferase